MKFENLMIGQEFTLEERYSNQNVFKKINYNKLWNTEYVTNYPGKVCNIKMDTDVIAKKAIQFNDLVRGDVFSVEGFGTFIKIEQESTYINSVNLKSGIGSVIGWDIPVTKVKNPFGENK